jgi:hypothetical protein
MKELAESSRKFERFGPTLMVIGSNSDRLSARNVIHKNIFPNEHAILPISLMWIPCLLRPLRNLLDPAIPMEPHPTASAVRPLGVRSHGE